MKKVNETNLMDCVYERGSNKKKKKRLLHSFSSVSDVDFEAQWAAAGIKRKTENAASKDKCDGNLKSFLMVWHIQQSSSHILCNVWLI